MTIRSRAYGISAPCSQSHFTNAQDDMKKYNHLPMQQCNMQLKPEVLTSISVIECPDDMSVITATDGKAPQIACALLLAYSAS